MGAWSKWWRRGGLGLAFLLGCSAAVADEGPDLDGILEGWASLSAGHPEDAAALAVRMLRKDAGDLLAHELYLAAHVAGWGDGASLVEQYRSWRRGTPNDETRRMALALALVYGRTTGNRASGFASRAGASLDFCTEATEVLPDTVNGVLAQSDLAHIRSIVARACRQDATLARQQLEHLSEEDSISSYRLLGWRLTDVEADLGAVEELIARLPADGRLLALALEFLDSHPPMSGPDKKARRKILKAAMPLTKSDDVVVLELVARVMEDLDVDAMVTAMDALHRQRPEDYPAPLPSFLIVREAERATTGDETLKLLDNGARSGQLGDPQWVVRAEFLRGQALEEVGRPESAHGAYMRAWNAGPAPEEAPELADALARSALLQGQDRPFALEAVDAAIEAMDEVSGGYPPEVLGDPGGLEGRREQLSRLHALAARLLTSMERPSEAITRWRSALTVSPSSMAHLELGLLLHAADRPADAVVELLEGLSHRSTDVELASRARAVVDKLFSDVGYWHPDGAVGFVKARRRAAEREEAAVEAHALGGLRFPIPSFERLDGDLLGMEEVAPVVLVALWTASCPSCLGMNEFLEGIAQRYAGEVTVVALAADARREDAVEAIAGQTKPTFQRAWDPRAGDVLRASRLPALYVVGENRRVVEVAEGFDLEVRVAIEAAVAAAAARAR